MKSDFKAGCAIAAVANERLEHPELGALAGAVFVAWQLELEEGLAAVEGALILCRSQQSLAPLDAVNQALVSFVDS